MTCNSKKYAQAEQPLSQPPSAPNANHRPDWRWRYVMDRLDILETSAGAEEFFFHVGDADLLRDQVLAEFLFPFMKLRLGQEPGSPLPQDELIALHEAMDAASELVITTNSWSLRLEAGILAGLPAGEIMPDDAEVSALGQMRYEEIFFDVRSRLRAPRELAASVFADADRVTRRGAPDLVAKAVAYGLGGDAFENWRMGSASARVKTLTGTIGDTFRYLEGLKLLGLERPDDMAKAFGRLFEQTVAGGPRSGNGVDAGSGLRRSGYTREQIEALLAMIPRGNECVSAGQSASRTTHAG